MTENKANNTSNTGHEPVHALLPDFCDIRNIFVIVLLTELLAIVFSLVASSSNPRFWDYLALSSFIMQWIALLNATALCLLRRHLHRLKPSLCLGITFLLMMSISLFVGLLVDKTLEINNTGLDPLFMLRVMIISAVIYFVTLRYFYIQQQWRINHAAQSRAEIQALRARIRPHFLFNSMNTIASLIAISPETAEQAIEDLSDLFRASLSEKNMNRLGNEIELAKSYLAIESLRLGDRLHTEWQIDEKLLDLDVPALCLQPLVENAIYHGIEPMEKGGKILISALQIDNEMVLSVNNPLMPENKSSALKKGNRMAQDNIRQRLQLVYGNKSRFIINDTKDNYTVSLLIPLDVIHERTDS